MSKRRIRQLFQEGHGIIGMIAEAKMKAKIISNTNPDLLDEESHERMARMSEDLDRYRDRLNEICEEIESYGTFSEMARE